jgi:hypothetical protein
MVDCGVRPGPARSQHPGQGLAGLVQEHQEGMKAESGFVGRRRILLLAVHVRERGIEIQGERLGCQSRRPHPGPGLGPGGIDPGPKLLVDRVQETPRGRLRATGPNSAGWARIGARSDEYPPPSAAMTAKSTSTRPGPCLRRRRTRGDNATDRSSCNPHRSAISASNRVPEWLTKPLPSAVTGIGGRG